MNKLIAIKEAAELLGVDPKTLRRWESDGKISPQKTIGGHRRYLLSEIEAMQGFEDEEQIDDIAIYCRVNKMFVVTMYRWGNRENHSYLLGVFDKKELAFKEAFIETIDRGGKYNPEIISIEINNRGQKDVVPLNYSDKWLKKLGNKYYKDYEDYKNYEDNKSDKLKPFRFKEVLLETHDGLNIFLKKSGKILSVLKTDDIYRLSKWCSRVLLKAFSNGYNL